MSGLLLVILVTSVRAVEATSEPSSSAAHCEIGPDDIRFYLGSRLTKTIKLGEYPPQNPTGKIIYRGAVAYSCAPNAFVVQWESTCTGDCDETGAPITAQAQLLSPGGKVLWRREFVAAGESIEDSVSAGRNSILIADAKSGHVIVKRLKANGSEATFSTPLVDIDKITQFVDGRYGRIMSSEKIFLFDFADHKQIELDARSGFATIEPDGTIKLFDHQKHQVGTRHF